MSHELGHNFSRPHAPCGGVANPDPNYPYAGGVLSATPLMDSVPAAIDIISPVEPDRHHGLLQRFVVLGLQLPRDAALHGVAAGLIAAQIAADVVEQDLLLIAGTIGLDGLTLAPVQALRGVPSTAGGEYTLRLTLSDGTTIEHAIEAELVDHAEFRRSGTLRLRCRDLRAPSRASRCCEAAPRSLRARPACATAQRAVGSDIEPHAATSTGAKLGAS